MLHFCIDHTTPTNDRVTEVHLRSGWKIISFAVECAVEIWRNDASDEVHISGSLTLENVKPRENIRGTRSTQVFSRLMKVGSASEKICFGFLGKSKRFKFDLDGDSIIFNITQNCAHMKSLVALSNELEGMLDPLTSCFADVHLKCDGESIPAHKNILSTRSAVFAAMFKNSMRESIQNEVEINDIKESVFKIMLTYIYTGKTLDLTVSLAADLLFAADKYQLQDLKRVCCDFLKDNLSVQNVLSIVVLGDQHSENELKNSAINYICNDCIRFSDLEETEEWNTIMKERSSLAKEILSMVKK